MGVGFGLGSVPLTSLEQRVTAQSQKPTYVACIVLRRVFGLVLLLGRLSRRA